MKYQKPSKPCTNKRRNLTRLDKATGVTQTKRKTRYIKVIPDDDD